MSFSAMKVFVPVTNLGVIDMNSCSIIKKERIWKTMTLDNILDSMLTS